MIGWDPWPVSVSVVTWERWSTVLVSLIKIGLGLRYLSTNSQQFSLRPPTRQFYQAIYLSGKKGIKVNTSAPQATSYDQLVHYTVNLGFVTKPHFHSLLVHSIKLFIFPTRRSTPQKTSYDKLVHYGVNLSVLV